MDDQRMWAGGARLPLVVAEEGEAESACLRPLSQHTVLLFRLQFQQEVEAGILLEYAAPSGQRAGLNGLDDLIPAVAVKQTHSVEMGFKIPSV